MTTFAKNCKHWILIIIGSVFWSLTMVKSGLVYDYGMGFWGPNGHDGVWHVSLASSLARGSTELPIFAGENIKNYHLGFDLTLAGIHTVTRIPIVNLYFQILPPLFAIAIGWLVYKLTNNLWSVFFTYFGGSLGWVFGGGESMFWAQQSMSTLINPPFAMSLILLLVGLILIKNKKYWWAGLVFAVLPHIKIYAGLLAFGGLLVAGLKDRNLYKTLILSLIIYLVTNYQLLTTSSSLVVWRPGWFLETMMALSDRFNWPRFYEAMINYQAAGNYSKAILAYGVAFGIFVIGNMGTRIIGLVQTKNWFYTSIIGAGLVLPMFFVQSGTAWNTIQFFYYSLFFAGILAGLSIQRLPKILKVFVVMLTIPTAIQTLPHYLPSRPPAKISIEELDALKFLSTQPAGVVVSYPAIVKDTQAPRPLYEYESTAYVSAFSGHSSFLEDEVNLNIMSYDWFTRRKTVDGFWKQPTVNFLIDNNITYVYLIKKTGMLSIDMSNIFENSEIAIYRVK